jgi:hypothetical protein
VFLLENIFSSVEPIISFRRYMFVAPSSLCVGTREGFGVGRGRRVEGRGRGDTGDDRRSK